MAPAIVGDHATDEVILALVGGNGFGVLGKFGVIVAHMRRDARDEKRFRIVRVVRQIGVIVQAIYIMKNSSVKFDRRCIFLLIVSARARNQKRACNRQKIECPFHSFNLVNL